MKKIILSALGVVVLVIAGLFAYAALKVPADFRVARSIEIQAPAAKIFPFIDNLQKQNSWNPWIKLDPEVKISYDGPAEGVGASTTWDGNSEVGAGRASITNSTPGYLVRMRMDWLKPMEGTSTVDYSLKQLGETTTVEWVMFGTNNIFSRVMCIFMNMDTMVGGMFEKGLSELKTTVEAESQRG